MNSLQYNIKDFKGRDRRLLHEWQLIEQKFLKNESVIIKPLKFNASNLPVSYIVEFYIRSISGVKNIDRLNEKNISNPPVFSDKFVMKVELPPNFPNIEAAPVFKFLATTFSEKISLPWHPNIRFFGEMKGLVCLNRTNSFTDLVSSIERIAEYLKYHKYHASLLPPFPEDLKVAEWVRNQGEPNGWINF